MAIKTTTQYNKFNSDVIVDYYEIFGINRQFNISEIKGVLDKKGIELNKRHSTTKGEMREKIGLMKKILKDARKYLSDSMEVKEEYDRRLNEAYQNGTLKSKLQEEIMDIINEAIEYYEKMFYDIAISTVKKAFDNNMNDPRLYEVMARAYYETGDINKADETLDIALSIYKYDLDFWLLSARYNTNSGNYEKAQQQISHILELEPENSEAIIEQFYLYLASGNEEIAYKSAQSYINSHPDDIEFKNNIVDEIMLYAENSCFVNGEYIADEENYEKYKSMSEKCYEIFPCDNSNYFKSYAKVLGMKSKNLENAEPVKLLTFHGVLAVPCGILEVGYFFGFIIKYFGLSETQKLNSGGDYIFYILLMLVLSALSVNAVLRMLKIRKVNNKYNWKKLRDYYAMTVEERNYEDKINRGGWRSVRVANKVIKISFKMTIALVVLIINYMLYSAAKNSDDD